MHRELGPALFESAYDHAVQFELEKRRIPFEIQVPLRIVYDGHELPCVYRADIIVDNALLLELKSVDRLLPIHDMQVLTYLRLAKVRQAFLINFNVRLLKDGIKSFRAKSTHEGP